MEYDIHTVLDGLTLAATLWVIYELRGPLKSTYQAEQDNIQAYYVVSGLCLALPSVTLKALCCCHQYLEVEGPNQVIIQVIVTASLACERLQTQGNCSAAGSKDAMHDAVLACRRSPASWWVYSPTRPLTTPSSSG